MARSSSLRTHGLDFDALQLRIHPAASRVKLLVAEDSGIGRVLRSALRRRSRSLQRTLSKAAAKSSSRCSPRRSRQSISHLQPMNRASLPTGFAASKVPASMVSSPSPFTDSMSRTSASMLKVKHERDCDCVVAGFRWHKKGERTDCRFAAARPFRRCGRTAARWCMRQLPVEEAAGARRISRALSQECARRSPLEGMGRAWNRPANARTSHARRPKPLEPGQRPIVGAPPP